MVRIVFRIASLPFCAVRGETNAPCTPALFSYITMAEADYYDLADHEAASIFFCQKIISAKYSAAALTRAVIDFR
jgi:hypothetical protein